ncbi:Facilitated trehalose transporter Tret1 [Eumeta japonica]|uniref:Facilitated trehalose transporter Tret1 n=1 Tax=Eumeta variegata TaxID=151549 RepID=A0A4C1TZ06_EUMVA|nr:Facilitated trehalose transporter Tret1 [Eumeta japonica]
MIDFVYTGSLVSSILAVGALLGALPVGMMAQKIGRKPTILILAAPFLLNWLLTIFANGVGMLVAGRFVGGIATEYLLVELRLVHEQVRARMHPPIAPVYVTVPGVSGFNVELGGVGREARHQDVFLSQFSMRNFCGVCVVAPMYIGEIAETAIRGSLGAFFQLFLTIGILFTFLVGACTTWRQLSIVCAIFCPLLVIVFWWMPETPQYLLRQNRKRDAERTLRWLRGPHANVAAELDEMQKEIDDTSRQRGGLLSMVSAKASRMALICGLGLMFFQQFSGINAVIFYTNNIFQAAGSNISPSLSTIIVGIVQSIATYMSSLLVEKAGRKLLLLQSCVIMGSCLIALGIYFTMQEAGYSVSSFGWLPLLSMILFIISFSMGFGPIPWMMMAELFSVEYRGTASGITVIMNWTLVFVVTLCFPIMQKAVGINICFFFFSAFMVVCVFFVLIVIPETKGKTTAQIQAILGGKN